MNIVSREAFAKILTWPEPEILKFMLAFAQHSRLNPDDVALVPYVNFPDPGEDATIRRQRKTQVKDFGYLFAGNGKCRKYIYIPYNEVLGHMKRHMPWLDKISFEGYVMAGSCPLLYCAEYKTPHGGSQNIKYEPHDADFYLVNNSNANNKCVDNDSTDETVMACYRRFLTDMEEAFKADEHDGWSALKESYTTRNENCTTIASAQYDLSHVQIVHRVFKSKQAVVVGFDQIPCKVFYDGHPYLDVIYEQQETIVEYSGMTYFTLDAALAHYFGINPVDWRRESPSHMRRVEKYQGYGYCPIFPGLKFDLDGTGVFTKEQYDLKHGSPSVRSELGIVYKLPGCNLILDSFYPLDPNTDRGAKLSASDKNKTFYEVKISFMPIYDQYLTTNITQTDRGKGEETNEADFTDGTGDMDEDDQSGEDRISKPISTSVFVKEDKGESDYAGEINGSIALGCAFQQLSYHTVSSAIRGKLQLVAVYASTPTRIISEYQTVNPRVTLSKITTHGYSEFYFGGEEYYEMQKQIKEMSGKMPMSEEELSLFISYHHELRLKLDQRCAEIDAMLREPTERLKIIHFNSSNPGAQFSASFNPIFRNHPRDYWGPKYTPWCVTFFPNIKLQLLLIRKHCKTVLSNYDSHIMNMLMWYIDQSHINEVLDGRDVVRTLTEKELNLRYPRKGEEWKYFFPWYHSPVRILVVNKTKYLKRVKANDDENNNSNNDVVTEELGELRTKEEQAVFEANQKEAQKAEKEVQKAEKEAARKLKLQELNVRREERLLRELKRKEDKTKREEDKAKRKTDEEYCESYEPKNSNESSDEHSEE